MFLGGGGVVIIMGTTNCAHLTVSLNLQIFGLNGDLVNRSALGLLIVMMKWMT